VAQRVRQLDYLTTHTSLSPIRRGFVPGFVNYKKGCTRLAAASDKVYQLLSHGRWFSPGTPASSTTKTDRHDKAEILLKVVFNNKSNQINHIILFPQERYVVSTTYYFVPTTYYVVPSIYCFVPTTYYLVPSIYYLVPTTYYLVPSIYHIVPSIYYY
jgi:hypothetical protein